MFHDMLEDVLAALRDEDGVQAVFLTGSVRRGDHDAHSDLDVGVLVKSDDFVRNDVSYHCGVLVSVERSTPAHRARAFTDPETALWNLHSLQTGLTLHDPDGVFAALQERARAVQWADLRPRADAQAAARLAGTAEELHKVMGGLATGDDAKVAYALLGLTFGLGIAALLSTGTVTPTENRYLTLARDAWTDQTWRVAFGTMVGLEGAAGPERGIAALNAYIRAVNLVRWPAGPEQELAQGAAERAGAYLAASGA